MRESASEILQPGDKGDENVGVPSILQDGKRIKYTDNDAQDYATTPIEPIEYG